MKFKTIFLCIVMMLSGSAFADANRHGHKASGDKTAQMAQNKKMMVPGYCEIEIINRSYEPVNVTGNFIDGDWLDPFSIYPYEYPHYISLSYFGCQPGMYLTISNFHGYVLYTGYTPVYQTLVIEPIFGQKHAGVKLTPKSAK